MSLDVAIGELPTLTEMEASTPLTSGGDSIDISSLATQVSVDALPTLAELEASADLTATADISAVATQASVDALNNLSAAEVSAQVVAYGAVVPSDLAGLATTANVAAAQVAIVAEVDGNEAKIDALTFPDVSGLATQTSVDALPTLAELEASADLTAVADVSGVATPADVLTSEAAILAALPDPDEMTEAELHAALDTYVNKDDWKADPTDLTGLNNLSAADVRAELAVELGRIDVDVSSAVADVSALATSADVAQSEADVIAALPDVSGLATQASVDALPDLADLEASGPLTAVADVSSLASQASVDAIPTLAELEASTALTATADVSALATQASIGALNNITADDVWNATVRSLTTTPDATLSAGTVAAIATAVEQSILDEADGSQVLNAIVGAIGNMNVDEIALVAAIRADIERTGGAVDSLPTLAELEASADLTNVADVSGLATPADVSAAQAAVQADIAAIPAVDNTTVAVAVRGELQSEFDDLDTAVAAIDLAPLADDLNLITKYHDNDTSFFAADGTTLVPQTKAFFMVVFDDDGSVLKRIEFVDATGAPTALPDATGYVKT